MSERSAEVISGAQHGREASPVRRRTFIRQDAGILSGMTVTNVVLHVLGWGTLLLTVGTRGGSGQALSVGLGVTAYVLGMRHAFDIDHIAMIDNTTRKFMSEGKRPLSVGFWFSLGHSTVVFLLVAVIAAGATALTAMVTTDSSTLQHVTGLFGATVSSVFLLLIGLFNLAVFVGLVRVFRQVRRGEVEQSVIEEKLARRGTLGRVTARMTAMMRRPLNLYPIGFLFGLGFDTATEIALLVVAGGAAAASVPWYALMSLPVLFASGMCLLDSADGVVMFRAYSWASDNPVRKLYYNLSITGLSVAVALLIGAIQIIGVVAEELHLTSGPIAAIASLDLSSMGFIVAGLFVAVWLGASSIWKLGHFDERWQPAR